MSNGNADARRSRLQRWAGIGGGLAILLAAAILVALFSQQNEPVAKAGAPLLQTGDSVFHDAATKFGMVPPGNWSMQMRALPASDEHDGERPLVKYKRLLHGWSPAWVKVSVADVAASTSLGSLLVKRSPGDNWGQASAVEELTVAGHPAARITFAGQWDKKDYVRDIVAVRRGEQVFYIAGTFEKADPTARRRIQQAVDTVVLDGSRPVAGR
jgi:hypothetical protein